MKTFIRKNGDTVTISLKGKIGYESVIPFREDLDQLIAETEAGNQPRRIIFNLEDLEFVGSCGISSFIQILKEFNSQSPTKARFCNVRSEFQRIMKALDNNQIFEFFENEEGARKSYDN